MTEQEIQQLSDDDLAFTLSLARRVLQFAEAEAARRGMTEEQIVEQTTATIAGTDERAAGFLARLKGGG
jgi:hypothetical protein